MHNPISPSGPWTLGVLIGTPAAVLVALVAVGFIVVGVVDWRKRRAYSDGPFFVGIGAVGLVLTLGITAFAMYPFNSEFHQWRDVHGTVQQVSHRLIADDKSMSERFVFIIDGQPFGVDDTRASLVKVGDSVDLKCKHEFQYAANSGWACNWGGAS